MLLTWLKKSLQRQRTSIPADFHSPDVLRAIIERERLRHDRTGGSFALLTVKLVSDASRPGELADLCEVLQRRLRATDDVGLLKPDCAGVLLPDTEEIGARKVVKDLEAELTGRGVAVEMGMLIYPAEPESASDGDSSDANSANSADGDSRDSDPDDSEARESNGQAKALAELLAQPLPPWKRLIDVATASTALLLLSPLLLLTALIVKLTSRGPVFYVQRRTGLGARPFSMYKFRTMVVEADQLKEQLMALNEQDGPAFKIERDPRVTWIGRLLRCTSIDELPQLWNVLRGQMSLVGPRPLPVKESAACRPWQLRRLDVTPGLTCIWQVKDRRNKIAFNEWMRMDLAYVESRTLGHDLKLMLLTIRTLLLAWRA
ncbi:MAG: sugar transferase [Planctomycetia bacterium]|nr:sugar transferase [Planctomycetia bacterium]